MKHIGADGFYTFDDPDVCMFWLGPLGIGWNRRSHLPAVMWSWGYWR